jgi:ubiquinone/menaquinone biosynthesis C-methylase UbiE
MAVKVIVGPRAVYDAVAEPYDQRLGAELDAKPLDRALLTALTDLVGPGTVADLGCGPGHATRFLAARHTDVIGVDLSARMIAIARTRAPELGFVVGSLLQLPVGDRSLAGAAALYSIIHLTAEERAAAFRELARAVRPGGVVLLAFHIDAPGFSAGEVNHLTTFFGRDVQLDGHFLDPDGVLAELHAAGFLLLARLERRPIPDVEYPSRRCYLLAQRG